MKKSLLAVSLLISSVTIFCQGINSVFQDRAEGGKKKKTDAGIRFHGGINFSGLGGESESYTGSLPGVYFGATTNVLNFSEVVSINAGLQYSQMGSKYESYQYIPGGEGSTSSASVRMNYLTVPVTAKYQVKGGFFGEAGVRPGLLLSAKDKHDGESDDIKSDYKSFDMGLLLGAGYQFHKQMGISIHYYPGLLNVNKVSTLKDRNHSISVGFHYLL